MKKHMRCFLIAILVLLALSAFIKPAFGEGNDIVLEFFYSSDYCGHCEEKKLVVNEIESYYADSITVVRYPVDSEENLANFTKMRNYGLSYPSVVVWNTSAGLYNTFNYSTLTEENLKNSISYHLAGNYSESPPEINENTTICFFGICIDVSQLSLPVLTITMAFLDSFNPCSFFILIFLLNLLIYVHSRRRMLLVGGIFIFFSGFIYFLLMAAILNVFLIVERQFIITIFAGIFALIFGIINIKDFFYFKEGPSLSMSKEKKLDLFKRMRNLIKTPHLLALIAGTIVLAIFANTYELLCSLGFPLIYTTELATHNLGGLQYYSYLTLYNIIYVVPLLIILLIFVIKLGGRKLTEQQGRLLKLISGIMMFSLGIVLLLQPNMLKNVFVAVGIIIVSIISSVLISIIWKKISKNTSSNN